MQRWLQNWIMNYVDGDPAHSSESTKAQKPLAAAEVTRRGSRGEPGALHLEVLPATALSARGLTVSLRLVSKLPSAKAR